ncbi:Quinone oxidoreductase-like protein 2-like protein [Smittium culicis]|uniref:Quinone oxidoreductase-like protein 2-like protein n=1 Tax=Smittium culicis TaxID=133412 RepID=A0A1R1Y1V2_9FUNG|nr:Quinone oxidoreductase-like protein 2-like protein [Smittium culicis]OMJ27876.1 Quinone oxidoreductase-like protein 2-like protein [Smittium culicis]
MMKAIVVKDKLLTCPDDMRVSTIPVPKLEVGHALVHVESVGANFFDILMIQGKYQVKPPMPFTPGSEFSGTIEQVHPSCTKFKVGDRVFGSVAWGAYAQKIAAPESQLFHIPSNLNFDQAAGIFVTYPTSYAALKLRAELQKGQSVLVLAAAGGVGIAAVQIAKAMGATVIAAVGSEAKFDVCLQNGADHVISYGGENSKTWTQQVLKLTNGKGVNVVYDPIGMIAESLKCIAWNGKALVVGFAGGNIEKIASNRILLKNVSVVGIHWGAYTRNEPERIPEVWEGLFDLIERGLVTPVVYNPIYYGLENSNKCLNEIISRRTFGKVVVKPNHDSSKL